MRKRFLFAVLAATAATGLVTSGAASARTDTASAGPRVVDVTSVAQIPTARSGVADAVQPHLVFRLTMTNNKGGQCLDGDATQIPANGARVQLWACNGRSNQTWLWTPAVGRPTGFYTIQNADRNQCLDGDVTQIPANGARVQLWACNGFTNQIWAWHGSTLTNVNGGQCLDGDATQIPANGARVQLWACNGFTNQAWTTH
ncbi:RICIN domain-containing protein [Streptomyces sp. H39-C1]|uniref:RICIN domain-containing protein n=1 Tax=Streptomyces sp. H39-C1 TaxID=3004355 RepID=UPI0022AFCB90|nr:RICIN domain-containing protein [Streptomyces sp. H39-C1]MCZ4096907.1 RICIN domain-containing protein [Streptomyces sp. H39-C1]